MGVFGRARPFKPSSSPILAAEARGALGRREAQSLRGEQARLGWETASLRTKAKRGEVDWGTVEIDGWMRFVRRFRPINKGDQGD